MDDTIKKFKKDNDLRIDGRLMPDGETAQELVRQSDEDPLASYIRFRHSEKKLDSADDSSDDDSSSDDAPADDPPEEEDPPEKDCSDLEVARTKDAYADCKRA